jgi:hypothetical protein
VEPILSYGFRGNIGVDKFALSLQGEAGLSLKANPQISGNLSVTCKFEPPLELPIGRLGGIVGTLMSINLKFDPTITGTAEIDAQAMGGEATVKATVDMPLLPKLEAPQFDKVLNYKINSLTSNLNPLDVDGPAGSLKLSANVSGKTSVIVKPGNPVVNDWITTVLNQFTNIEQTLGQGWGPEKLISLEAYLDPKFTLESEVLSMKRAFLTTGKPSATFKGDVEGSIAVQGWVIDQINTALVALGEGKIEARTQEFPLFEFSAKTPENTQADVLNDTGQGSATLAFAWKDGEVSKVQLGKDPVNSLHRQSTTGSGGPVTYNPLECDPAQGLSAAVLGLGTLDFGAFKISGLPFHSGKTVNVCQPPARLAVTQPAAMSTYLNATTTSSFEVSNTGVQTLRYEITRPNPKPWLSLSLSSGSVVNGTPAIITLIGTCPSSVPSPNPRSETLVVKNKVDSSQDTSVIVSLECKSSNKVNVNRFGKFALYDVIDDSLKVANNLPLKSGGYTFIRYCYNNGVPTSSIGRTRSFGSWIVTDLITPKNFTNQPIPILDYTNPFCGIDELPQVREAALIQYANSIVKDAFERYLEGATNTSLKELYRKGTLRVTNPVAMYCGCTLRTAQKYYYVYLEVVY